MTWDTFGYSAYLPLSFVHHSFILHDLTFFEKINEVYGNTPTMYQFITLENGNVISKYTIGWSVVMSPFYFIADIWARNSEYRVDGFSLPYQYLVSFGSTFYSLLGIHFLRKILLHFFNDIIASISLILITLGTNYLFIQMASVGSVHSLEFTFLAILIWLTIRFHEKPSFKKSIYLGVCIGVIGLIRPPDLIFALIPVFWNCKNGKGFIDKLKFYWKNNKKEVLGIGISCFLVLFIQSLFWKITSGHFLIDSYNNAGEGFDFFKPYTFEVLFSFRKGWFLYTPLIIFSIIGLFYWKKKDTSHGNFMLIILFLFVYVISSWTTWWYASSFSQRAAVDIYPLLAIGFGFFIIELKSRRNILIFSCIGVFLFSFNLFQTWQISKGILHTSLMTKEYYFSTFGQFSTPSKSQQKLLLIDKCLAYEVGFKNENEYKKCYTKRIKFPINYQLNDTVIYTPIVDIIPSTISKKDHFWIRSTWNYEGNYEALAGKIFTSSALYKLQAYGWVGKNVTDSILKVDTIHKTVTFNYLSPDIRTKKDPIRIIVWKQSGLPIIVKSVLIEGFEKK